jgi:hypothetical protein
LVLLVPWSGLGHNGKGAKKFAETSHNGNEDFAECPAFMNHDPPCPDFHFTTAGDRSTNQHTKPREGIKDAGHPPIYK